MKKNFFAIYALVGAFIASPVFTSCVDDTESASVTAIRDAKTAELKSIAALKKAEAQAKATLDAAQIAYKNAQAEAQIAQAKYNEAQAALKETQNEEDAIALMVQKKEAEKELAAIQAEMERQEVAIQAALLDAQAELLNAKKQLDQTTQFYSEQEKAELQTLAYKYSNAVDELLNAKKQLISMESTLAMYETGFADAKKGLEETVASYNNQIEKYKIYIDQFKQYANYTEDLDALKKQHIEALGATNLAWDKYNAANNAFNEANNNVDGDKLDELYQAIQDDAFFRFTEKSEYYDAESESYMHFHNMSWDFTVAIERDENFNWILGRENDYQESSLKSEYEDNTYLYGNSISYEFEYLRDIRKTELVFAQYIDPIKADIKAAEDAIKADNTALTEAEKAVTDAKKAWDEAEDADKDAKKYEYENALNEVVRLQNAIKSNEANIENWNKNLAIWTGALDMLKNVETLNEALQAKIKAYNDAVEAEYAPVVEAWKAQIDAYIVANEADATFQALDKLLNGVNGAQNISAYIEMYEFYIEENQGKIEEAKKLLVNHYGEQLSYEDLIAFQKSLVEAQKAVVAAKEVAVADAKAALDAAMPTEETPAE